MLKKELCYAILGFLPYYTAYSMDLTHSKSDLTHSKSAPKILLSLAKKAMYKKPSSPAQQSKNVTKDTRVINGNDSDTILNCFKNFTEETINSRYTDGDTPLIYAARCNSADHVVYLLSHFKNINPNAQNDYGNTALHYTAQSINTDLITFFISDPRIDTTIKNNEGCTAHNYIPLNENDNSLRVQMFARIMLDYIVNMRLLAIQNTNEANAISHNILASEITIIKQSFNKDHNQQIDDRALPVEAQLPAYADDEFISQLLYIRLMNMQTN